MNPNQLHQATAILRDGVLYMEGYTTTAPHCPRPNSEIFRDCSGTIMHKSSEAAWNNWLASKVSYPVKDDGLITLIASIPEAFIELRSGIAIDSILHRIEIVSACCGRCDGINDECDNNGKLVAVLKGEGLTSEDKWIIAYGKADEYLTTKHPIGKVIGYNHSQLIEYLSQNYTITPKTK